MPLSLALLAFAPGCYLLHGQGCGPAAGMVCCDPDGYPVSTSSRECPFVCPAGTRLRSAAECRSPMPAPLDAGAPLPPPDASVPPRADGGVLTCPLARASATCMESFLAPPGRPFDLPIRVDACSCCPSAECAVEVTTVDGAPTLLLTTGLCPGLCDCDACNDADGVCHVPALAEGAWSVVVNGAPAFTLPVFADSGVLPPPAACATYAEDDACSGSIAPIDAWGWRANRVCVDSTLEHARITATADCFGCGDLHGPCLVRLEPRFTDDLPPGGELFLGPTAFPTECDVDCPAICLPSERTCLTPRLNPGDYYRVWNDGEAVLTFIAGEGIERCNER